MSIYVGNLPYEVEEKHLGDVFGDYGKVKRVYMPVDRDTGRRRGFGFVEMETLDEEDKAIASLDKAEWMGRQLKVNKAKDKESSGFRGSREYKGNSRF